VGKKKNLTHIIPLTHIFPLTLKKTQKHTCLLFFHSPCSTMNPIKKQIIIKNYGWGLRKRLVTGKNGGPSKEKRRLLKTYGGA
jgi:hypothetical protein